MSSPAADYSIGCAVIGAGVVGLAGARGLALAGEETLLLERESGIGTGISSRNSEVIHAGIYYPAGSLKAQFCVRGKALLYEYCRAHHVPHFNCGKLIVATDAEETRKLEELDKKARANGVEDLRPLGKTEIHALEPEVTGVQALFSPSTGIIDSHALMDALLGDFESASGSAAFNAPLQQVEVLQDGFLLHVGGAEPCRIHVRRLVNAAGLHAVPLLHDFMGFPPEHIPQAFYAKGNYFVLAGRSPFTHLVYPMPVAAGLGVHATIDLGGQCRFGPDVEWISGPDDFSVDATRSESFYAAVRRYWPGLQDGALQPGYAGIRPKLQTPDGAAVDFVLQARETHGISGLVNLLGIESPGLTSSLALAETTKNLLFS